MNTITVQLNDKQFNRLCSLIDLGASHLRFTGKDPDPQEKVQDLLNALNETKSYLWTSSLGEVDLDIPAKHIDAIAHPGDNEPACREAIESDPYLKAQLERMDISKARGYLKDAGIEGVNYKTDDLVRVYILWMAAWDIHEERNMED